jgi:fibronectin-binding autotransporter adhesin
MRLPACRAIPPSTPLFTARPPGRRDAFLFATLNTGTRIMNPQIKSRRSFRLAILLLSGTALAGVPLIMAARAENWTGATSTDWFTASNWDSNAVPTTADAATLATIATNPTVIDTAAATAGELVVGSSSGTTGSLTISNGGSLTAKGAILAENGPTSTGTVTLQGGSTMNLTDSTQVFEIGYEGIGHLNIFSGSTINGNAIALGDQLGSFGYAAVDGAGSVWNGSSIAVGLTGTGTLFVGNGGALNIQNILVGNGSGSGSMGVAGAGTLVSADQVAIGTAGGSGMLTVEDSAIFNIAHDLVVGGPPQGNPGTSGTGVLSVTLGGVINTTGNGDIGALANYQGTVTVDGAGSRWQTTHLLIVGDGGTGALTVSNGGVVGSAGSISIGNNAGSSGTVIVTGAGSHISSSSDMHVGVNGTGSLEILDGAFVSNQEGSIGGGNGTSFGTGTVTVDGAGSRWINTNTFFVGSGSAGTGTLTIQNGGLVGLTDDAFIGSQGVGTVTVTGAGSMWTSNQNITIGGVGQGTVLVADGGETDVGHNLDVSGVSSATPSSLAITTGGVVTADTATIGGDVAGYAGNVTIDGAGSALQIANGLTVGEFGGTGTVALTNGGAISAATINLGDTGSTGTVIVDGAGSALTATTLLAVGLHGTGTLTVQNGGSVSGALAGVGYLADSTGTFTVTGAGSQATFTDTLAVGALGTGTFSVLAGGSVTSALGLIGFENAANGTALVDGLGSIWTANGIMAIGAVDDATGALTVSHGGEVDNVDSVLGGGANASGVVTVSDTGSLWFSSGTLTVGSGAAGTILAQFGGSIVAHALTAGDAAGSTGTMTVTGTGSTLTVDQALVVGNAGTGVLSILNGGAVTDLTGSVSGSAGGAGTVLVDGANSSWTSRTNLTVGGAANGGMTLSNGGVETSSNLFIGRDAGVTGTVIVDGTGSLLNSSGITAGVDGTGILTVRNGGALMNAGALVAGLDTGSTGTITITGAGSTATVPFGLEIGVAGSASLSVLDGGQLVTNLSVVGGSSGGNGTAFVDGAGSGWTESDEMEIGADAGAIGALTVSNGGQVTVSDVTYIGFSGAGTIAVAGPNSNFVADGGLAVGFAGSGRLIIADDGLVTTPLFVIASEAGSIGETDIGAAPGAAAAAPGVLDTPTVTFGNGTGSLNFNHTSAAYAFAPAISGVGTINQIAGTTILTADSSAFTGPTYVTGGTLLVNGATSSATDVASGGTLGGTGTIHAAVGVADGGALAGIQGQTLIVDSLALSNGSNVDVSLAAPGTAALFTVNHDLLLDGVLNITAIGSFGPGLYRLMDYGGNLTDNGLDIGTTPAGTDPTEFAVQTAVAGQVNLIDTQTDLFWDGGVPGNANNGAIDGGSGTWSVTAPNWTDANGFSNAAMVPQPGFAIFEGAPGTVTVDDGAGAVSVTGMQFAANGYVVLGDAITLAAPQSVIRVGDGTAAGSGYTATIASALIGSAELDKTDLGTLILTGANTYTGGTVIVDGTLVGSATSFGTGVITDNATLVIDQPTTANMANVIAGTGTFTKRGAGSLNLTGVSTLTGPTTVAAGRLAVNGSLANSVVTVQNGGTLGGNGTVGGVVAQNGGIVAPGNSIGALTVNGNYSAAAGSVYQVELDSAGHADQLNVTGTATLANGAVLNISKTDPGVYVGGTQYKLLTAAGGLSGSYTVTGDVAQSAFLGESLSYDAHDVYLNVVKVASFASAGATPNQKAVGGGLDTLTPTGPLYAALVNLPTFAAAQGAFDQLSGEIHASARTALIEDSRFVREAALERLQGPNLDRPVVWGQGFGDWGSNDGNGNVAGMNRSTKGFIGGVDVPVAETWRVGVLGGFSDTGLNIKDRSSAGTSTNYHLGLYGGTETGPIAVRLGAAYSWLGLQTARAVAFNGFSDQPTAKYNGGTTQAFGEVGYNLSVDAVSLEPFANLAYVNLNMGAFQEAGGSSALNVASATTDTTFTTLGLHAKEQLGLGITAKASLGWRHAFGDVTPVSTNAFAGGTAFSIDGVPVAQDAAAIDAGFDAIISDHLTLGLSYTGQFASDAHDNGVKANVGWKF